VDRIVRWYIPGEQSAIQREIGGTFVMDFNYVPQWVHISLRRPVKGTRPLRIDITDDGVSIFDDKPALIDGQADDTWFAIPADTIEADSILKLNRDQIANIYAGEDLTVELGLQRS